MKARIAKKINDRTARLHAKGLTVPYTRAQVRRALHHRRPAMLHGARIWSETLDYAGHRPAREAGAHVRRETRRGLPMFSWESPGIVNVYAYSWTLSVPNQALAGM